MSAASGDGALVGQVAIVTGAGRGIGRAIALALAEHGADVSLAGRTVDQLEEVAALVREKFGVRAIAVRTDITDVAAVDALVALTLRELGDLHILVNNSGIWLEGSFLEMPQDDFDRVVDTNLRGTVLCCRAAGAHLVAHGRGKVINISSFFGEAGFPGGAAYCASKAAIANLTRVLALEWAPHGVQVNAIAPGYIATDLNAEMRADEAALNSVRRRIPAGRLGHADEVATLAAFLAGHGSDFMVGSVVVMDGGQLARV